MRHDMGTETGTEPPFETDMAALRCVEEMVGVYVGSSRAGEAANDIIAKLRLSGFDISRRAARSSTPLDDGPTIGPIEHSATFCRKAEADGSGCRCWCRACEHHNAVERGTLVREGRVPAPLDDGKSTANDEKVSRVPVPLDDGGLDAAWREAATALRAMPGGSPYLQVTQDLMAWAMATGSKSSGNWDAEGDTPAEALRNLAVVLSGALAETLRNRG